MNSARLCVAILAAGGVTALAGHWPAWRGPEGSGICAEKHLPVHWGTNLNVRWRVGLPERGNSTPIIWGDRVFITQAISQENRRTVMCFDRRDGKVLWQNGVVSTENECSQPQQNPQCTSSPVTDGHQVIVWFGSAGLFCYDMRGREMWRLDLGKQSHVWGYAASPILYKDLCILNFGPGDRSFLIAVDKKTGKTVWRYEVPPLSPDLKWENPGGGTEAGERLGAAKVSEVDGSWATPIIVRHAGHDELVVSLPLQLHGFAPGSGELLWTCDGPHIGAYSSPFFGDGVVAFTGSGFHTTSMAVRPGGRGNVTATHRLWFESPANGKPCVSTGVVYEGHIYQATIGGFARCLELESGKSLWEERLAGTGANNASWSSLILAKNYLYIANQSAEVFVVRASPRFECVATNSLGGEHMNSSPSASQGAVFLRTDKHLWCICENPD